MFELLIWIVKNIKWRKVNEKSCTARPIIFVEDSVDSRPFVLQFVKKFLSNYYSLSFKEINVLVLILCCYLYYYLPWFSPSSSLPEAPNAVCPLPSSQLFPADSSLPHPFFEFQGVRLIADFITTMSFTHGFFLTERPLFSIHTWQLTRKNLSRQFTRYTWPTNIGHFFSCKTWI